MTDNISKRAYIEQAPPIIGEIAELVIKGSAYRQQAVSILNDTVRSLKRAARRSEIPEGMERVEIPQARGPTVEFNGRLLCETSFDTRRGTPLTIHLEVWESAGGALIAVTASTLPGGEGREDCRVTVVPPQDDQQAMRLAVMEHFGWELRARAMVKKIGWSLRLEVD